MTPYKRRQADSPRWRMLGIFGGVFVCLGVVLALWGVHLRDYIVLGWAFPFGLIGAGMIRPDFILDFTRIWRGGSSSPRPPEDPSA